LVFIDEASAERIGLNHIRQRLQPLGPYGKLMKQKMPVYLPGTEPQLKREWILVRSILELEDWSALRDLELVLHGLRDIRAIIRKASLGNVLEDIELFEVKRFLGAAARASELAAKLEIPARLRPPALSELSATLARDNSPGFYLADSYAPRLAEYREERRRLKSALSRKREEAQAAICKKTGKGFNHQGLLPIDKLEEDLIRELSNCPQLVLAAETYTQVEFKLRESPEMSALQRQIEALEARIQDLEHQVRIVLSKEVACARRLLLAACRRLGRLDLVLAKARLARSTTWCVPEIVAGPRLYLRDFINLPVAEHLSQRGLSFQAISLSLGETPVTAITGANMGGKSVSLKSTGLAVAMAQLGLLVPAREFKFTLRDFIFYSQQDEDPVQGLSTFGAEISALAKVLRQRDKAGLYLLDEPARGTNPWEGNALVKAIAHWLGQGKSLTLIATHFPGLSELTDITRLRVAGLTLEAGFDLSGSSLRGGLEQINRLMNYALVPSTGEVPQEALKIAALLGLSPEILAKARQEMGASSPQEELME
jgi:DNA mismatch repair protein MutS2